MSQEGRGRGLTKVHLSEPHTLGLESVGKEKRGGQSTNGGSVVEGRNCTTVQQSLATQRWFQIW